MRGSGGHHSEPVPGGAESRGADEPRRGRTPCGLARRPARQESGEDLPRNECAS